jgi:peptidoglycan/LPS O-acetylase OafA/YrhL
MRDRLGTIQHLRGIACLMVAIAHCLIHVAVLEGREDADGRHRAVMDGTSAIFFFVISGFIMVHVSGRYGTLSGAWQFLTRRFLRIAPL